MDGRASGPSQAGPGSGQQRYFAAWYPGTLRMLLLTRQKAQVVVALDSVLLRLGRLQQAGGLAPQGAPAHSLLEGVLVRVKYQERHLVRQVAGTFTCGGETLLAVRVSQLGARAQPRAPRLRPPRSLGAHCGARGAHALLRAGAWEGQVVRSVARVSAALACGAGASAQPGEERGSYLLPGPRLACRACRAACGRATSRAQTPGPPRRCSGSTGSTRCTSCRPHCRQRIPPWSWAG